MKKNKLFVGVICLLVLVSITGCGKKTNLSNKKQSDNTETKTEVKAKCSYYKCLSKMSLSNTVDELNNIVGIEAKSVETTVENMEKYEYDFGNDKKITVTLFSGKVSSITMAYDKKELKNSKVTLDNLADVKAKIKEQKAADGKRNQEDQAVEQAVKNAEYEIPQPMIDTQTTQMVEDFAQRIQSQGITLEQYFQFTGLTAEKMMEDMKPQAIKRIETRLVLEAIAKAENIEITDEKVDEELAKMAESYNMEVEKLKEFMGENEKKQMKEDLAVQEAVTFLVENAVEK